MKRLFVVREARASDKDLVLSFSRNTFPWGDYIESVWDYWLTDPSGKLFVATAEQKPVGINHVTIVKRGEAWVERARVSPEFRRMGVASLLNDASLEWALTRGARVVRAVTDSSNFVAQKALAKLGFRFVSDWVFMEFDGCQLEVSQHVRLAEKSDVDAVWSYLRSSEVFGDSGGLFAVVFRWKSLGKGDLRRFVNRRMAVVCERGDAICGLILFDDTVKYAWHENSIQTSYVDGDYEAVLQMGRFLKAHLYELGVAKIYGVMHNHMPIVSAFSALGFRKSEGAELVYGKKLSRV